METGWTGDGPARLNALLTNSYAPEHLSDTLEQIGCDVEEVVEERRAVRRPIASTRLLRRLDGPDGDAADAPSLCVAPGRRPTHDPLGARV